MHVLSAMADDLEDWEHVVRGVENSMGRTVDEDTLQSEVEALIADGFVEVYELSSPGPEGRLVLAKPQNARLREELTYWFFPTEAGMRFYCDETGTPFPAHRFVEPS
jgi:hypothetical protein